MRNRWAYFRPVADYLGLLLWVFGALMLVPLGIWGVFAATREGEVPGHAFYIPVLVSLVLGAVLTPPKNA